MNVDENKCKGCGVCVSVCPTGFEMKDKKSHIKNPNADCIDQAISSCPFGAIIK